MLFLSTTVSITPMSKSGSMKKSFNLELEASHLIPPKNNFLLTTAVYFLSIFIFITAGPIFAHKRCI